MSDKTAIWNALCRTDPAHTKPFNRAGGFKGTAVKPIWIIHKLTEYFGPCGVGWGVNEPTFQVVQAEGEILVYCTVSAWHGTKENVLFGVGGDKVMAKRNDGSFCDDEAFKKAFTDAVNNAFKFIGVSGDVHMGQFDDDKYVTAARQHFEDEANKVPVIDDAQFANIVTLAQTAGVEVKTICEKAGVPSLKQLPASKAESVINKLNLTIENNSRKAA